MTTEFCPRDEFGFCRIALLGGVCLVPYDELDMPHDELCPRSEEEAREMLLDAVEAWNRAEKRWRSQKSGQDLSHE